MKAVNFLQNRKLIQYCLKHQLTNTYISFSDSHSVSRGIPVFKERKCS